ncbi:MAG: DUF3726 domain-containing protein [Alphaproteobacteria bacterium]|nr:DUF3726 domain-containing protein [Alphaproteobacteria bacterium]
MMYSLNEIYSLMLKAAIGSGLPMGLAEEVAAAGQWLLCHRQDGVGAVHEGLASKLVVWTGPSVLDHVIARPNGDPVEMSLVDAPLLFLGMAGVVSAQTRSQIQIDFSNGTHATLNADGIVLNGTLQTDCGASITRGADFSGLPPRYHTRVHVDPSLFQALMMRAALTYVPATEASRQRGAGAGLTDND